jgi:hypothetical protein
MKFSSIALAALPLTALAAVVEVSNVENKDLPSPGPPMINKSAQRKYFKFGRTSLLVDEL